jgi:hypothetical protein
MPIDRYTQSASVQREGIVSASGIRAGGDNWAEVGRVANQISNTAYQDGLREAQVAGEREGQKAVWVDPETNKPQVVGTLPEGSRPYAQAYRAAAEGRYNAELGVSSMAKVMELNEANRGNPEGFRNSWAGYIKGITENVPAEMKPEVDLLLKDLGTKHYYKMQKDDYERTLDEAKVSTFNLVDALEKDTVDTVRNTGLAGGTPEFMGQKLNQMEGLLDAQVKRGVISPQEKNERLKDHKLRLVRGTISGEVIKMAKAGKAGEVDQFLDEFRLSHSDLVDDYQRNQISDYARGEITTYLAKAKAEKNTAIEAAKRQVKDFTQVSLKGETYTMDDQQIMKIAESTGDPEAIQDVQAAMTTRVAMKQFSLMSPQEQEAALTKEKANQAQTPDTLKLRENLEGIYGETMSAVKSGDTIQLAARRGLIEYDPLDPANPVTLSKRAQDIAKIDSMMGAESNPLVPAEKEKLIKLFDGLDSEGKIAMYGTLKSNMGSDVAQRAMKQLGQERPAMAYAMGLSDDAPEIARNILMGDLALQVDKTMLGDSGAYQDMFRDFTGTALQGDDVYRDAVYHSALAVYANMVKRDPSIASRDDAKNNSEAFQKAIQAVTGGVAEYNGVKTIAPRRGMSPDDFEDMIDSLSDEQFQRAAGGKKLVAFNGQPVDSALIRSKGVFEWNGDGKYTLRLKVGGEHGGTVFQTDDEGQIVKDQWGRPVPAEIDLKLGAAQTDVSNILNSMRR